MDGSSPQKPITQFFPVTGVLSSSPQKAVAVKEEPPNGEAGLLEDDPFEGLTESMFVDSDDEMAVKQEEAASSFPVKQEGFSGSCPSKEAHGGTAGCSGWGWRPPLNPAGSVSVKVEKEDDDDDYLAEPLPDAHYGLLGNSAGWAEPKGQLGDLPEEILRVLFGHLPAEDLYRHISLVCHRWRDIVCDPLVSCF